MENNKNKKSVNFQGDMLNFCDFIQVFVFTTNHHLSTCFIKVQNNCMKWLDICFGSLICRGLLTFVIKIRLSAIYSVSEGHYNQMT